MPSAILEPASAGESRAAVLGQTWICHRFFPTQFPPLVALRFAAKSVSLPFGEAFGLEQESSFLNMPRVSKDSHMAQPQETFCGHLGYPQGIKLLRFQSRQDSVLQRSFLCQNRTRSLISPAM
jgi:hypothetical protein